MSKLTLLQIVQKVLSSLSSDEVSSAFETAESTQIVDIVEDVFNNLVTNKIIKTHESLIQLAALGDTDHPNYLKLTDPTVKISELRYNVTTEVGELEYREITWLEPSEFLARSSGLDSTADNVRIIQDFGGASYLIKDDEFPRFFTSFDNTYIVFDSFNSDEDSTMQASKSLAIAQKIPTFTRSDSFVPNIEETLFPLLLNEVKSWAHLELRQNAHQKAEQQARSQRVSYQRFRDRVKEEDTRPDYGRR